MSLSRWLRDYLYIPLGGNRGGPLNTYRNLTLTMLLGGLWHGANWNFVIWGGYHGGLLAVERLAGVDAERRVPMRWRIPRVLAVWLLAAVGWVFFRAVTLGDAAFVLRQMAAGGNGKFLSTSMTRLALLTLVLAIAEEKWRWFERLGRAPMWLFSLAVAASLLVLELFSVTDIAIPFVYFQF